MDLESKKTPENILKHLEFSHVRVFSVEFSFNSSGRENRWHAEITNRMYNGASVYSMLLDVFSPSDPLQSPSWIVSFMFLKTVQVLVRVLRAAWELCVLFRRSVFPLSQQMMKHSEHETSSLWGFSSLDPISFNAEAIKHVTDVYPTPRQWN